MRNQIDDLSQLAFLLADPCFCLLAIFNVDAGSVPFHDGAARVAERHFAMQNPAILSIRPPHARFSFEWFAGCEGLAPFGNECLAVFVVNKPRPAPTEYFFQGYAEKRQPALIQVIERAIRDSAMEQRRRRIDDELNPILGPSPFIEDGRWRSTPFFA